MKYLFLPALVGCAVFLNSCASDDDLVLCPPLSAPPEGARAFVVTDDRQQTVDVRLNGVVAECRAGANGNVLMEVKAGLKLTRNLAENAEADIAVVPMMTAILDADDQVVSNGRFGYKNVFDVDIARLLPVVEFELVAPSGGRAVISLTPTRSRVSVE
jgi:methyl coenzyme M reductase beta subunit